MAIIGNVNYEEIPEKTDRMRESGRGLCNEMQAMYNTIREMHADWYGVRYNTLVEGFNKMRPSINSMLELVFTEIPVSLDIIANNYSRADRQVPVRAVNEEKPKVIEDLPIIDDTGKFRFITSRVKDKKESVETNIRKAIDLIDEFESIYKTIQWESEAATAYTSKFTRLKEEIITSFNDLKKQFAELMLQAEEDIEQAEKANTVQ